MVVLACLGLLMAHRPATAQTGYAPVPQSSNDRYVPQKFDRSGAFIPPHYERRVTKPAKPKTHFMPHAPAQTGP